MLDEHSSSVLVTYFPINSSQIILVLKFIDRMKSTKGIFWMCHYFRIVTYIFHLEFLSTQDRG